MRRLFKSSLGSFRQMSNLWRYSQTAEVQYIASSASSGTLGSSASAQKHPLPQESQRNKCSFQKRTRRYYWTRLTSCCKRIRDGESGSSLKYSLLSYSHSDLRKPTGYSHQLLTWPSLSWQQF